MKVLIIGNGWLGNRIKEVFPDSHVVNNFAAVERTIKDYDVLINAAAKTNIDWCEGNKLEAFNSNVNLAIDLADVCYAAGKKYVFISSACIFESENLQDIKDEYSYPNPKCFYALTKWMAEELITSISPFALIVRIRLPISEVPHPRNTINKILTYPYLNTNQETVTVIEDFLPALKKLIEEKETGIFHLVNAGTISPSQLGHAFEHKFREFSKKEQDDKMKWEGRAKRVTAYVTSTRIPTLPDIRDRLPEIVVHYNINKMNSA